MPFFRKKPVIVEARQFTEHNGEELEKWCSGIFMHNLRDGYDYMDIPTLEGTMKSRIGDYIVKGSQFNEFWSVKKEIFEATYEAVTPEEKI